MKTAKINSEKLPLSMYLQAGGDMRRIRNELSHLFYGTGIQKKLTKRDQRCFSKCIYYFDSMVCAYETAFCNDYYRMYEPNNALRDVFFDNIKHPYSAVLESELILKEVSQ